MNRRILRHELAVSINVTFAHPKRALILLALLLAGCKGAPPADINALLLDACDAGNLVEVTSLIAKGANPNAIDKNPARKFTPLVIGTAHPDVVAFLLKHGADPKLPDGNGLQPVDYAASSGSVKTLQLLLDAGASPNSIGGEEAPLSSAASLAQIEAAKLLLERGAQLNFHSAGSGFTALQEAIIMPIAKPEDRLKMVEFLISKGADIRAKDSHGYDALDWAETQAKNRNGKSVEIVQVLRNALKK